MNKKENGMFEVPTLYDIAGSANFYNKADYGISVYRAAEKTDAGLAYSNKSEIHIQKVKFKHLGHPGMCRFAYNVNNGRYSYFDGIDTLNIQYDNAQWTIKEDFTGPNNNNDDITQTIESCPF